MEEEIKQLKEAEQKKGEAHNNGNSHLDSPAPMVMPSDSTNRTVGSKKGKSLFGPILLIAIGAYFLLNNLNVVDFSLNWWVLGRFWPLFLVFAGLNVIVRQARGAAGSILSGLVGVSAVVVFGGLLLFGDQIPAISQFAASEAPQRQTISVPLEGAETADVRIDFNGTPASLSALEDSNALLAGEIVFVGELDLKSEMNGSRADVQLDTFHSGWSFGPFGWTEDDRWELALNPRVVTDLDLDLGSGPVDFNLAALQLSNLKIDGGSGPADIALPDGDYDFEYDLGSGPVKIFFPDGGQHEFNFDGGSGPLELIIPANMEVRVDVDSGSGPFALPSRFAQVSGDEPDDGTWETEGYRESAADSIRLFIDIGSGPVAIRDQ